MSEYNLNDKTVIELRKIAKELRVPLSAGISKQGIIDKLTMAIAEQNAAPAADAPAAEPVVEAEPAAEPETAPEAEEAEEQEEPENQEDSASDKEDEAPKPAFAAPRFNSRPAYQAPTFNRASANRAPASTDAPRTQTTRPVGFQSRFGPAAQLPQEERPLREDRLPREDRPLREERLPREERPYREERPMRDDRPYREDDRPQRMEPVRSSYGPARSNYNEAPRYPQRSYDQPHQPAYEQRPAYDQPRQPAYEQRPPYQPRQNYSQEPAPFSVNPSASEIMQATECPEITGILELLPEGYGFLRSESMIASARDVYVASAQIRRFGLRTGDKITGKVRPLREGDKYPALLTVGLINGTPAELAVGRPNFDALTPIYPTRRIQLERKDAPQLSDLRLMDLITPIGFGQRGLIQCGPHTGKTRLLTRLANVITLNHPEAEVLLLLFNETPENVTVIRESVKCPVVASTFDMPPENHLRLADLVIERAQRLVEQKKDVVVLVDSLTTLIRVISTAAMQAGRAVPGMINPQSLQKAKRLFGAARCIREGGSLTVIATMNTDSGSKADDSVVGDFRGAANMELVMDQTLARAGLYPPFDLARCGTRRAEAILTPAHIEGLKLLRGMLGQLPSETALKELLSMMEKTASNEDILSRIKVWAESMKG